MEEEQTRAVNKHIQTHTTPPAIDAHPHVHVCTLKKNFGTQHRPDVLYINASYSPWPINESLVCFKDDMWLMMWVANNHRHVSL